MYIIIYVHMYIYMYIYTFIYIYICIHICTNIISHPSTQSLITLFLFLVRLFATIRTRAWSDAAH